MKGNTKGFTLVELLAVIVILAIVALVTTPAILNVINNARRSGAEDKSWGTIDAVKLAYVQSQTIDNDAEVDTYNIKFQNGDEKFGSRPITVSGERPVGGYVMIDPNSGGLTCYALHFVKSGEYTCTSNTQGTAMCCKSGDQAPDVNYCKDYKGFSGTLASAPVE